MKIVTKNYSLKNGKRSYLVYLKDENDNSLECYDVLGEEDRIKKENNLSEKHGIEDVEYVSLEEFREDEEEENKPLFLVFYLNKELFKQKELVSSYGANVKKYLDEKGDNVRLFFMPTENNEKIVCINPLYIGDEKEYEKLNTLIGELEEKFQLDID
jgi:hypothetical protein|tara:strand:- start:7273 stop:7743 length:471 start_codon:yes stop_codon:yes gene_type:complete